MVHVRTLLLVASSLMFSAVSVHSQGTFTVQFGGSGTAPVPLVGHGDSWRYHLGTTGPGAGWETNADATLDGTWLTGAGGFGYSTDNPAETTLCQTVLSSMF